MSQPKSLARACLFCRTRKIRCDTARPSCATCVAQGRECIYRNVTPNKRPTLAQIQELKKQRFALESFVDQLKRAAPEAREELLNETRTVDGHLVPPESATHGDAGPDSWNSPPIRSRHESTENSEPAFDAPQPRKRRGSIESLDPSSGDELDVGTFIAFNEAGKLSSFGPSSALHHPPKGSRGNSQTQVAGSRERDQLSYSLIAKAALSRQNERKIAALPDIHGVPTELAMHLLDLHWSRQHHTFLLTYRPTIMRDLSNNGPHCSKFLLYTIFATSSKYSSRLEVRDDPADPSTAGQWFFRVCDELISQDSLLIYPKLPTVVGLLLLGSTFNARGETSKAWLYTGYALRMIYDLGLHLDPTATTDSPEEEEVRRRVFWGAFICDKLQSLYLGRPVAMNLHSYHVSRDFMDTLEEQELYLPYTDPKYPYFESSSTVTTPGSIHSVSTFQQLCLLSKIMTKIINTFYVVGAKPRNAQVSLQVIDKSLQNWRGNLPTPLQYDPKLRESESDRNVCPAPNQLNLHGLYHSLIILLHRPFMSDGHLRSISTPAFSWARCTSAARSITSIALAWKHAYSLSGAPYLLSYVIYVACTVHVRNAAAQIDDQNREHSSMLAASLACLNELCHANPGVSKPVKIIQASMEARKVFLRPEDDIQTINPSLGTSDFDLTFNTSSMTNTNLTAVNTNLSDGFAFNSDMPYDPLFGLMGVSDVGFDMPSAFFDGTT